MSSTVEMLIVGGVVAVALAWAGRAAWRSWRKQGVCSSCGSSGDCPVAGNPEALSELSQKGQLPHLDFMTPIGIGAVWPIAAFVQAGLGMGHAIFAAQAAVAALLFLPAMRVALSRFSGALSWGFAFYLMVLCLALVHGEAEASISISMHYNRWAWALAYLAIPLAMLAPLGTPRPWLEIRSVCSAGCRRPRPRPAPG